jgi:hypothetical protein
MIPCIVCEIRTTKLKSVSNAAIISRLELNTPSSSIGYGIIYDRDLWMNAMDGEPFPTSCNVCILDVVVGRKPKSVAMKPGHMIENALIRFESILTNTTTYTNTNTLPDASANTSTSTTIPHQDNKYPHLLSWLLKVCDQDTVRHILSYLDFSSLLFGVRMTSHSIRKSIHGFLKYQLVDKTSK